LKESAADRLGHVLDRIEKAARRGGRNPQDVVLVAVTKTISLDRVLPFIQAGIRHIGETTALALARLDGQDAFAAALGDGDLLVGLAEVVDDLDRTNTVTCASDGQVASVTDFSGRRVTYVYYELGETGGSPGDLKSVTSPPTTDFPPRLTPGLRVTNLPSRT